MLTTTFIAVAILMAISAFFSGSETALTAVSRGRMHQLEKDGSRAAANVNRLVANRERMIGSVLLGNTFINILASSLMTAALEDQLGPRAVAITTGFMTVIILIFAEVLPKTLAIARTDRFALFVAVPLRLVVSILAPIVATVQWVVWRVLWLFGVSVTSRESCGSFTLFIMLLIGFLLFALAFAFGINLVQRLFLIPGGLRPGLLERGRALLVPLPLRRRRVIQLALGLGLRGLDALRIKILRHLRLRLVPLLQDPLGLGRGVAVELGLKLLGVDTIALRLVERRILSRVDAAVGVRVDVGIEDVGVLLLVLRFAHDRVQFWDAVVIPMEVTLTGTWPGVVRFSA